MLKNQTPENGGGADNNVICALGISSATPSEAP